MGSSWYAEQFSGWPDSSDKESTWCKVCFYFVSPYLVIRSENGVICLVVGTSVSIGDS